MNDFHGKRLEKTYGARFMLGGEISRIDCRLLKTLKPFPPLKDRSITAKDLGKYVPCQPMRHIAQQIGLPICLRERCHSSTTEHC